MEANHSSQTLQQALKLQQDNKLEEAKILFENLLKENPKNADALHGLGLLYAQLRHFQQAVHWFVKAIEVAPEIPGFHNNLGNAYKALNRTNLAMMHYREALRLKTPYPEVRNNLGRLLFQQGLIHEAVEELKKAIREDPDCVDAHYNLANCYVKIDRFLDAKAHYEAVLKVRADHLGAIYNLGMTLIALKDFMNAKPLLEISLNREPNNKNTLFHLAVIENAIGHTDRAQTLYERVLSLDPEHTDTHHNLATLFLQNNKKDLALQNFKRALELNPSNQIARHMILALEGKTDPKGAPTEFIKALFDQYAYNYNSHMKSILEYKVPMLLRQALTDIAQNKQILWRVLDLGCGTGLCAPYFRDIADKFIGIDLSENMIEMAQAQGGYDSLIVGDAMSYLERTEDSFNLIIASDVIIYFGELESFFASCVRRLKAPGFLTFSIEKGEGAPYRLNETGRYVHSRSYIETLANQYQLTIRVLSEEKLRMHEEEWVQGYIVLLEKPETRERV